jgi:hypothetical protein
MTKDEALRMALKNLLVATNHLDVCPGTVQAAEEALAQPEQPQQAGYVLVPVDPTIEMINAGRDVPCIAEDDSEQAVAGDYTSVYRAMLEAAPKAQPEQPEQKLDWMKADNEDEQLLADRDMGDN